MCVLVFLIPESPIWLVRKRQYNRADKALAWLQQEEEEFAREVEFEFQNRIIKVTENQNGGQNVEFGPCDLCCSKLTVYLNRIFSKKVLLPFFIVVSLFFFQNWSGFIVTIFYTVVIFQDAAIELDEFHATILVGKDIKYCTNPDDISYRRGAGDRRHARQCCGQHCWEEVPPDCLHRSLFSLHGVAWHCLLSQET